MIRKFRAIVQTSSEPLDHEVLWYWKGKLLYWGNSQWEPFHLTDAFEVSYTSDEDDSITSVEQALDKLLYVTPGIKSFALKQAGTYERGITINTLDFSWSYNKKKVLQQKLDGVPMPTTVRLTTIEKDITSNTSFSLWMTDGTNTATASTSIKFVDYIYYGCSIDSELHGIISRLKVNPSAAGINVTANAGQYIWIFIPKSAGFTKLWHNNTDSTDDFTYSLVNFNTDTNLSIAGTLYVSKNHSLNNVILKFT